MKIVFLIGLLPVFVLSGMRRPEHAATNEFLQAISRHNNCAFKYIFSKSPPEEQKNLLTTPDPITKTLPIALAAGHFNKEILEFLCEELSKFYSAQEVAHIVNEVSPTEAETGFIPKTALKWVFYPQRKWIEVSDTDERSAELVSILLQYGASITKTYTPDEGNVIHLAINANLKDTAQELVRKSATSQRGDISEQLYFSDIVALNQQNGAGLTPLAFAIKKELIDVVARLILCPHVDINSADRKRFTPLHYAILMEEPHRRREITEMLLRNGAHPDMQDRDGNTPLHFASNEKDLNMVELLLHGEASPNIKNNQGNTPLYYALQGNILDSDNIIVALIKNGASVLMRNNYGQSPYDIAKEIINDEYISYLIETQAKKEANELLEMRINELTKKRKSDDIEQ